MGRYRQFLADLRRYIWAQRYPAAVLLVVGLSIWVAVRWPQETPIRWCGAGLQILGILTVAYGIRKTRRDSGQPGLIGGALRSLMVFPHLPPRSVRVRVQGVEAGAMAGHAGLRFDAKGTLTSNQQEQIDALRRELSDLQAAYKEAKAANERGFAEAERMLAEERAHAHAASRMCVSCSGMPRPAD